VYKNIYVSMHGAWLQRTGTWHKINWFSVVTVVLGSKAKIINITCVTLSVCIVCLMIRQTMHTLKVILHPSRVCPHNKMARHDPIPSSACMYPVGICEDLQ
jgi:hypothetical protein